VHDVTPTKNYALASTKRCGMCPKDRGTNEVRDEAMHRGLYEVNRCYGNVYKNTTFEIMLEII
jgi:hypothetical protein